MPGTLASGSALAHSSTRRPLPLQPARRDGPKQAKLWRPGRLGMLRRDGHGRRCGNPVAAAWPLVAANTALQRHPDGRAWRSDLNGESTRSSEGWAPIFRLLLIRFLDQSLQFCCGLMSANRWAMRGRATLQRAAESARHWCRRIRTSSTARH